MPSVEGPVDQTRSTGAWDGALGQRTDRPAWSTGAWDGSLGQRTDRPAWSTGAWDGALGQPTASKVEVVVLKGWVAVHTPSTNHCNTAMATIHGHNHTPNAVENTGVEINTNSMPG